MKDASDQLLYRSSLNFEVFILQRKISPLLEDIEVKSSDMRFAAEQVFHCSALKAELTFDLYIL